MSKTLYIETTGHQRRYALVENSVVCDFFQECSLQPDNTDSIYYVLIRDIVPALQGCFVDTGETQKGFLRLAKGQQVSQGEKRLVQLKKPATKEKGALLTTRIALTGRHIVLNPFKRQHKISRQIRDNAQITRLQNWLNQYTRNIGITLRSDAQYVSEEQLCFELNWLLMQFETIKNAKPVNASRIYTPPAHWLNAFNLSSIDNIIVDSSDTQTLIEQSLQTSFWSNNLRPAVRLATSTQTLFSEIGINSQIDNLYSAQVDLSGGGHLIIEKTRALTSIDINSGSDAKLNDFEENALAVNLQAAQVIAKQIRLRNLCGIIMLDFINLSNKAKQHQILIALRKALQDDSAIRHVSSFSFAGVIEIVRTYRGGNWQEYALFDYNSSHAGQHLSLAQTAYNLLRDIQNHIAQYQLNCINIRAASEVIDYLNTYESQRLNQMQQQFNLTISLEKHTQNPIIGYHINSQ